MRNRTDHHRLPLGIFFHRGAEVASVTHYEQRRHGMQRIAQSDDAIGALGSGKRQARKELPATG